LSTVAIRDRQKPSARSDVPKFETELRNGEDRIMTKPQGSSEMAQAFALLAENADLQKAFEENLRREFKTRHWKSIAKQHISLYEAVLEKRTSKPCIGLLRVSEEFSGLSCFACSPDLNLGECLVR